MAEVEPSQQAGTSAAGTVAAGILASRLMGFLREVATAYFFGVSAHADVFRVAFRGPNVLQNLLGEGTISAAFIPIYSRLIEEGRREAAGRFAGAIFGLLLAAAAALVLLGVVLAPYVVTILAPGFTDDAAKVAAGELVVNRYTLSVAAVRLIFPMTGLLVLSAWALGVLNSHRRFFLPYFAPVLWNAAIIAALFVAAYLIVGNPFAADAEALASDVLTDLLFAAFIGALVGGLLQFLVQLPLVFKLMKGFRFSFSTNVTGVREAIGAFGPVVAGRGVAQLSTWLDLFLASLLAAGAVGALGYAQTLYILPVSLFGLSVAASELPELSRISHAQLESFLGRVDRSARQVLFLTIPTVVGYIGLGFLIVGAFFQRGSFGLNDTWLIYLLLAAYSIGLGATTVSRLLQNSFYALKDTKTPAKIAVLRVVISTVVALPLMFFLDRFGVAETLGLTPQDDTLYFGALGLAFGASVGAWVELWRLTASLRGKLEQFDLPWRPTLKMMGMSGAALVPAVLLWWLLPPWSILLVALIVISVFAVVYLGLAHLAGLPEMDAWAGRLFARFRKS